MSDDEAINRWLAECRDLVVGHLRAKGVPVDDYQVELVVTDKAAASVEQLREMLRAVQSDPGNWLHPRLQDSIEAAVGPPGPWRALDDPGVSPLEREFDPAKPEVQITNEALHKIGAPDDGP